MEYLKRIAAILLCAGLLTGCASTKTDESSAAGSDADNNTEGTLLYQSELVNISYTDLDSDEAYTYLNLEIENLTDGQLIVAADNISVNGTMIDPFLYTPAEGGKTTEAQMEFLNMDLEERGIESLGHVEFSFFITDGTSTEGLERSEIISLDLGEAVPPVREEGVVIYDSDGLKITYLGMEPSDSTDGQAAFDVQNDLGQNVIINIRDVYIDGTAVTAELYHPITDGMYRVCDMFFWDEGVLLEDSEVLEFEMGAFDPETYESILETGTLTVDLQSMYEPEAETTEAAE